jgi:multicomponent Na+:H+ antiporter subunit E
MSAKQRAKHRFSRLFWMLQTAVALFVAWLALDGVGNLLMGALLALIGAAAGAWLVPGEAYPWRPLRMILFIGYFLRESARGGVDVAWRALAPGMPIQPEFIKFELDLPSGLPKTLMVAVISLLPGTLSVRLLETGQLEIHALTPRAGRGLPGLQRRIRKLFSVDVSEEKP